jgi:hypothetical protein
MAQVMKCRDINTVTSKALAALGHIEHFEPARNLVQRGSSTAFAAAQTAPRIFGPRREALEEYTRYALGIIPSAVQALSLHLI